MDKQIDNERSGEEKAFARRYLESLAPRKVEYAADYSSPVESRPRKIPAVQVPVVVPPDLDEEEDAPQDPTLKLTIKSLRPALSLEVEVHGSDSVADLKKVVEANAGPAFPATAQRLVLKGKALADAKLLKEYDLADGAVLHVMLAKIAAKAPEPVADKSAEPEPVAAGAEGPKSRKPSTLPQLTISSEGHPPTKLGEARYDESPSPSPSFSTAAFHSVIASPEFWQKVHTLCHEDFATPEDADTVVDTFLMAMKGRLSASEIAKIRDCVDVAGMGGGS